MSPNIWRFPLQLKHQLHLKSMTHCVVTSCYFQGFQLSRRSFSGVQGTFAFTQMQMHVARTASSCCLSNGISRELSFRALHGTLFFIPLLPSPRGYVTSTAHCYKTRVAIPPEVIIKDDVNHCRQLISHRLFITALPHSLKQVACSGCFTNTIWKRH